jgi:hypothetical protein
MDWETSGGNWKLPHNIMKTHHVSRQKEPKGVRINGMPRGITGIFRREAIRIMLITALRSQIAHKGFT